MPLIGNQLASAENNSFRVLDNISNFTLPFDGSSSSIISAANNYITLYQHPFVTGQRVTYSSSTGNPIGGLLSGSVYYIVKLDQNTFRLSTTYGGSLQNTNLVTIVAPGTGVNHSFNVAFDGFNTKFKATYSNGTKCSISRAAQLDIAINGVVQQPYDSNPPPNGFTVEADSTIVFSTPPLAGYTFWGKALTNSIASFETSDNSVDTFTGNGVQTNFILSKTPANSQNVLVTVNGVVQYPSDSTGIRAYSVNANVLAFTGAPANGSVIQVRYIGFAGATSSNVTGFYGRTGNVVLTSGDNIAIGTAKIGTGTVGINTTLLVEGNVRITGILTVGTGSITINGNTDTIAGVSSISNAGIVLVGSATSTGTPSQRLQVTGGAYVSDNLGIGTTNPSQKLEVVGNAYVSGKVGIGTTNPTSTVVIRSDNNGGVGAVLSLQNRGGVSAGTLTGITFGVDTSDAVLGAADVGNASITVENAGTLNYGILKIRVFDGADSESMKICGSGVSFSPAEGGDSSLRNGVAFANAGVAIDKGWASYPGIMVLNANAYGSTTQSEFRIHGWNKSYASYPNNSGADFGVNLRIDGSTYFSSDARHKTNITDNPYGLDAILQLQPRKFNRINSEGEIEDVHGDILGFIAQEVKEVIPEAVNYYPNEDNPNDIGWCRAYALSDGYIVSTLVNAVKEQQEIINQLKSRIESLESKNSNN